MRKFLSIVIFLFMVNMAFASFSISTEPGTLKVKAGERGSVNITISSTWSDTFTISIEGWKPWFTLSKSVVKVDANEKKSLSLYLFPPLSAKQGVYIIGIYVKSQKTGEKKKVNYNIEVQKNFLAEAKNVEIDGVLRPKENISISYDIINTGSEPLSNVKVKFYLRYKTDKLTESEHDITFLNPSDSKHFEERYTFAPMSKAGRYTIEIETFYSGEKLSIYSKNFDVQSVSIIETTKKYEPVSLGKRMIVLVRNDGNEVAKNVEIKEPITWFDKIFYNGEGTIKYGNVVWTVDEISPGATAELIYQVNYVPLFVFLVLIVVALWYYFFKVRVIRIKKFVIERKRIKTAEIFTIAINVKNNCPSDAYDVVIRDFVPSIFKVGFKHGPRPKIKKTEAGTELAWHFKKFDKAEERLLVYYLKPVIGILGSVQLPSATVSYKIGKREWKNHSESPSFGEEE
ncbi:MAG: hypothetical protein B6U68_00110 [Candidatus Aenigmarchaeota archaeon ex4484_14]|nr:MAG: hypothetical protein B6U68_00110 [Candidatus Aenigmarchaeota archaeon ex4484_14]